ncbi:MAG: response regulator transcription factor [Deltaproteobacteria bacterium]|nr:response regulator transcription factor [Deltaproteobacteria bacterium]
MSNYRRVILACEYALDREAILNILASEEDIEIVAEIPRPRDIERLILSQIKAELLILDIDMFHLDLLEILRLIRKKAPTLIVLLLTEKYNEERIVEAICAGSLGYVLKSASASELIRSVRALINGEVWIERKMMAKVISKLSLPVNNSSFSVVQGL